EHSRWCVEVQGGLFMRVTKNEDGTYRAQEGEPRDYSVGSLSFFLKDHIPAVLPNEPSVETLRMMYESAFDGWKELTETRFKLLGLVPAVSVIAWGELFAKEMTKSLLGEVAALGISIAGFLLTTAIQAYDKRNDQ